MVNDTQDYIFDMIYQAMTWSRLAHESQARDNKSNDVESEPQVWLQI